LEDEARLLDLKRLLHLPAVPVGGPPSYVLPGVRYVSDHLSIEREGQTPYLKLEDRMYTAEEVRKLVGEVRLADTMDDDADLAPDEVAALNASRERFLKGEGQWLSREELEARMKERTGK